MSIEVRDKIGTASVTVHWDATTGEPEMSVDISVDSAVFTPADCLKSLASASRRMAEEIEKKIAEMRGDNPLISDEEY